MLIPTPSLLTISSTVCRVCIREAGQWWRGFIKGLEIILMYQGMYDADSASGASAMQGLFVVMVARQG